MAGMILSLCMTSLSLLYNLCVGLSSLAEGSRRTLAVVIYGGHNQSPFLLRLRGESFAFTGLDPTDLVDIVLNNSVFSLNPFPPHLRLGCSSCICYARHTHVIRASLEVRDRFRYPDVPEGELHGLLQGLKTTSHLS